MISQLFPVSPRNPLNLKKNLTISGSQPTFQEFPWCQRHCCDSASPKSAHKFLTEPWKVDVLSINGKSKNPSHKNIRSVTIACYHFNGQTQHMLKFGQSFKRVLKQPMISIEFWGKFTKCSTTDCWKTPLDTSLTRHQTDLSTPCKLTCASLIMSKKAMPLLYPPKKGLRKFERYLWETSLLFNTKKRAPSDCASRGNLLMRMCFCLIHFASNNSTLQLLGKIEVTNSIGTESDFSKCLQRG